MMTDQKVHERITQIYVLIMLTMFPLAVHSGYVDILDTKWIICLASTCMYLAAMLITIPIVMLTTPLRDGRHDTAEKSSAAERIGIKKEKSAARLQPPPLLIFSILYILAVVFGMLTCSHKAISFWGLTGRYMGVMTVVPLTFAMLLILKYYRSNKCVFYCAAVSSAVNFILQILNEFKIDPFNMWKGVSADQIRYFAGTTGNLNFNAVYDCMMLSAAAAIYMSRGRAEGNSERNIEERRNRNRRIRDNGRKALAYSILISIYIILNIAALICTRSDGAFLGLAAILFIAFVHAFQNIEKTGLFAHIIMMLAAGSALLAIICICIPSGHYFELTSLAASAVRPSIIMAELAAALLMLLSVCAIKRTSGIVHQTALRLTISMPIIVIAAAMIYFASSGAAKVLNLTDISDHSAHNRVFVWRNTLGMMRGYSVIQWIVGCGINEFRFEFADYCGAKMALQGYNTFIDAHSEYLQALASTGTAGTIGYFGMIITIFIDSVRRNVKRNIKKIDENGNFTDLTAVMFIVSFLAQGLVYAPQIVTTPLLFVMLGAFGSVKTGNGNS